MTVQDLIKEYEEELIFCDEMMKLNSKHKDYWIAERWKVRQKSIRAFITDLKKLLV